MSNQSKKADHWGDDPNSCDDDPNSWEAQVAMANKKMNAAAESDTVGAALELDGDAAALFMLITQAIGILNSLSIKQITVAELGQCRVFGRELLEKLKIKFKSMKKLAEAIAELDGNFKFDGESVPAKLISNKNTTQETTPNFVKHVVAMVEKYQSLTIAQLGQPRLMDEARIREMKDYVGHQNGWATRVFELSVQSSSKVTLDYSKKPLTLYLA